MQKIYIIAPFVLLLFIKLCFAQELIFEMPWGNTAQSIGLRQTPEGQYGPQSFKVFPNEIQILDNGNRQIKIFKDGRPGINISISPATRDFVLFGASDYALNVNNEVLYFSQGNLVDRYSPAGKKVIRSLQTQNNTNLNINFSDGTAVVQRLQTKTQAQLKGQAGSQTDYFRLYRRNAALAEVQIFDGSGNFKNSWQLHFKKNNLASLQYLGQDMQKNVFMHTELFENQVPLKIRRQVIILDSLGVKIATFEIPLNSYAYIQNDLYVDNSGRVYQLYAFKQGIRILKWTLPIPGKNPKAPVIPYPDEYDESSADTQEFENHSFSYPGENFLQKNSALSSVTPEYALATGDSYVQLHWNCGSNNLTNGLITDSYGYKVRTPDWLYVGNVQRIPYKWGGFQTVQQFLDGISAGKYAGDNYTSKSSGTPSAVGVDCSGFVSRCWNLPNHYSTRAMPDITIAYDSWDQTRPGDACHKVGHVRLIVAHAADGSLDMVEAAGFNWRVSYTNYRYSSITAYTPRYYKNMEGTPGKIPQPVFLSILNSAFTDISWKAAARETIAEFIIEESDDSQNWTELSTADANSSHFKQQLTNGQARYYRMHSIAVADGITPGISSDVYGLFINSSLPKILIVDGFDRTMDTNGSWPHSYHSFAAVHGRVLQKLGIPFETVANEAVINGLVALENYEAVIWMLGDESTGDETFNYPEQLLVSAYLEQGGKLFVSGSEIAWDLDYKGSAEDKNFIKQYFKASLNNDNAASFTVSGADGTPFSGLTLHYDDGSHGVYEEDYPDALNALNGGQVALKYANGKTAAVYYSGLFPGGSEAGQIFYMGFPFETIYNEDERRGLMGGVLSWFGMAVTAIASEREEMNANRFTLYGNYPNPFNGQTRIRFYIPNPGLVTINIYNTLGQKVRFIEKNFNNTGMQDYSIDASNLSSGEYFYRLSFSGGKGEKHRCGRFLLIK